MTFARTWAVAGQELRFHFGRPLFWVLVILLALMTWGLSTGSVRIQSGDTSTGGREAWITSEYNAAMVLPMMGLLLYGFFVAVAAGMAVPRDDECKVQGLLHSTPLTPAEYVAGKFSAALSMFVVALAIHVAFLVFFNNILPNANADKIRGPLQLVNYLRPAIVFLLPTIVFICGVTFAVGEWTRKPILIFVFPVACFLLCGFFLWDWSPTWLDPQINRLLMWIEPTGFRWINETWIKLDRGIDFYNHEPVGYDLPFLLSRAGFVAIGILAAVISSIHLKKTIRGSRAEIRPKKKRGKAAQSSVAEEALGVEAAPASLRTLGMTAKPPGFVRTAMDVARFEAANLFSQPGLYLFIPIILLQIIGSLFFRTGAFETPLLLTPGVAAIMSANTLTILVCLLLLFYTVESVLREKNSGLSPISYTTPSSTAATLFGKALANGIIAVVIMIAALIGAVVVILIQGKVVPDLMPFLIVWGGLLVPTFLVWSSFVVALLATTGSRYLTYALALATMILTFWFQFRSKINWVGNWDIWNVLTWSDFGVGFGGLSPNGKALLLNRLFGLSLMVLFIVWTVRVFPRREFDSAGIVDRMRPKSLGRLVLRLLPFIVVPVAIGFYLNTQVLSGFQGKTAERREKEYWGRNLITWADEDTPHLGGVDIDLTLDPKRSAFKVRGTYRLVNWTEKPMRRFPMSVGDHFENIEWTMAGEKVEPDDHARMFVFEPKTPLAPGDTIDVGFSHEGRLPRGITKNGRGMSEFILEEGVVLTSFQTTFLPVPFYEPERGVKEDENKLDPRDYQEGFWEGITKPGFGGGVLYPVRTKITGPAGYEYHGVGVKTEEKIEGDTKTVVWVTDSPVNFFNVVAGKWDVYKGETTEIWHHPKHTYNLEEMSAALDASRKYYSEWFYPYPWRELRLNEFPAIANYAQGFPSNITFSESIGFLTRSSPKAKVAFMVTAHEAAHQWWGNILLPGQGPGANILSEGMAHFSTILLTNQMLGESARIELCKRFEERYGDGRQVDSEKPLVWIDGSKDGDTTVTYDKGGWVFWMLRNLMGDEANSAGCREFIGTYASSLDHPVLQDFVRVMRTHAPDSTAYDEFAKQWFFEVNVPEYRFADTVKEKSGDAWVLRTRITNAGTGSMPVQIAATRGERFVKQTDEEAKKGPAAVSPDYREARITETLGPKEERTIEIRCDFEPESVLVDPDAKVLQLKRKAAVAKV